MLHNSTWNKGGNIVYLFMIYGIAGLVVTVTLAGFAPITVEEQQL